MKQWLLLHTPDGREFFLDLNEVESVFEGRAASVVPLGGGSTYQGAKGNTQINMKSGDKGECRETFAEFKAVLMPDKNAVSNAGAYPATKKASRSDWPNHNTPSVYDD